MMLNETTLCAASINIHRGTSNHAEHPYSFERFYLSVSFRGFRGHPSGRITMD
jgi:hypothetical protein